MPFAKMPKTNRRTDILPNMVAVFRIILYYKRHLCRNKRPGIQP